MIEVSWPTDPELWRVSTREASDCRAGAAAPAWVQCESLAQCLRAVLTPRSVNRSYLEVVALLGLGSRFRVSPDECVAEWALAAQDAALTAAATAYGLQLREMHPPDAAAGLPASAEFPQHFADSYLPLIRRALENGQPCIARRGWPPPTGPAWGVITSVAGNELSGITLGYEREAVTMIGPATQVYVVEAFRTPDATEFEPDALLRRAAAAARAPEDAASAYRPRSAYLREWKQWRHSHTGDARCPGCGGDADECWLRLHTHLYLSCDARRAWFDRVAPNWDRSVIDALVYGDPC